jgi:anti-sigma regulatory factor (Ser/Thr protein kinase)
MATEPCSQIVLQVGLEQLPHLERWVTMLAAEYLLPAALVHRVDSCLSEIMSNLIDYGYPDGGVGTVSIRFWRLPEQIVVRIDDDGAPFDPTAYVPSGLPSSLEDASIGGRGIRLVRHFADELHHLRAGSENQLTLVFRSRD